MTKSITINIDSLIKEWNITNTDSSEQVKAYIIKNLKDSMNEIKRKEGDYITFNIGKLVETLNIKEPTDTTELKELLKNALNEVSRPKNDKC